MHHQLNKYMKRDYILWNKDYYIGKQEHNK